MKYKRVVFKVGTSSVANPDGSLSSKKIRHITDQLSYLHKLGHELVLVSSGAITMGYGSLGFRNRPTNIAEKQASAAVGQGLLLEEYTRNLLQEQIVSAQVLLTQGDFSDKRRYKNVVQAITVLLNRGAIPVINENDTVTIEEIKVGDNDTLGAQVAAMLKADLLVLLTDIDGLYTDNPLKNPSAKRIGLVNHITPELISMASRTGTNKGIGGMLTKLKAAALATKSGVPVYICSSVAGNALLSAVENQKNGTFFPANSPSMRTKKQWLAFYAPSNGSIFIDEGAEKALLCHGKSLLLSGVVCLSGHFSYHDVVTVYDARYKRPLGKGKVLFGKDSLEDLLQSRRPKGVLIHRNDWISMSPEVEMLMTDFF